jgi:hypothetical protein
VPRFVEELDDFGATFYRAGFEVKGPKRHDVRGSCEQPFSKSLLTVAHEQRSKRSQRA